MAAFLHASPELEGRRANRFSLLLLEHGETYFEDFGVTYFPHGCSDGDALRGAIKGRLKLCSRSLILDPTDLAQPLIKFSFRKCSKIDRWSSPLMSAIRGEILVIVATEYVRMRGDNLARPYEFVRFAVPTEFRFSPTYVSLGEMLGKILRLFSASQPGRGAPSLEAIADEYQRATTFNTSWLEELSERICLETSADLVLPLVANRGRVVLTNKRIYFQPLNNVDAEPVRKFRIADITRLINRRYMLRDVGVEMFLPNQRRLYFAFSCTERRAEFVATLKRLPDLQLQSDDQVNMMRCWQCGEISNFDYLMYLNSMADRSFVDLAQYPVFPWVIADYTSTTLDLTKPSTFRDLSKPIGALNEDRLQGILTRYREMPEPKFMYGTHYSTPGYVLFYTIRAAPEYSLCLQNGKYDHADRLFNSIADTWQNVLVSPADVKELIPEFYMPGGDFLVNSLGLDLGACQDGAKVGNVALPPWASSAADFTQKCREALESDFVSANIHHWIDLVFGYKQTGPEAVRANNLFYYLTYEGAVDLEKIKDPCERLAIETQIMEFGQTPRQLFTLPHPPRRATIPSTPSFARAASAAIQELTPGPVTAMPSLVSAMQAAAVTPLVAAAPAITSDLDVPAPALGWAGLGALKCTNTNKAHRGPVTGLYFDVDSGALHTVSKDACLKLHALLDDRQLFSVQIGDLALSSCAPIPAAKMVAVGSWDNSVYLYSTEYGRIVDQWQGHDDAVSCVLATSELLLSASWDSTIKVWKLPDAGRTRGDFLQELSEHDGEVLALALHEERGVFSSGGKDGKVIVWSLESFTSQHVFEAHKEAVSSISFSPDGRRLASCSLDGSVKVFDIELGRLVYSTESLGPLHCLAYDGQYVVGGAPCGSLLVWDLVADRCLLREKRHSGPITCLCVSPDGAMVVTGSEDRTYCLWRV